MWCKLLRKLPLLFLLLYACHSTGRGYPVQHYTVDNGLPANRVYNIFRDSKGYLWFATDKGVAVYNGVKFKHYTTGDGLTDNDVLNCQEDLYGRIWICTFSGLLCYYKDGRFYNPRNTPFLQLPVKTSAIHQLVVEKDSSITVGFWDPSMFVNIKNNHCTVYNLRLFNLFAYSIRKVSDSLYDVMYLNPLKGVINQRCLYNVYTHRATCKPLPYPYCFSTGQNQQYIFDTAYIYSRNQQPLQYIGNMHINPEAVYKIYRNGPAYFIATFTGLYTTLGDTLLHGMPVSGITTDVNGNYWAATLGQGAYRFNKDYRKSSVLPAAYTGKVKSAWKQGNTVYFVTSARRLYRLQDNIPRLLLDFSEGVPTQMQSANANSEYTWHNNIFYGVSSNNNLFVYNLATHRTQTYVVKSAPYYKTLLAGRNGLFINTANSIAHIPFSGIGGKVLNVQTLTDTTRSDRIFCQAADAQRNIWYSRLDEIYKIQDGKSVLQPQFGSLGFKWFNIFGNVMVGCTHSNHLVVCRNYEQDIQTDTLADNTSIWHNAYPVGTAQVLLATNRLYKILQLPQRPGDSLRCSDIAHVFMPRNAEYFLVDPQNCFFFKDNSITILRREDVFATPAPPVVYYKQVIAGDSVYYFDKKGHMQQEIPYPQSANIRIAFDALSFSTPDVAYEYAIEKNGSSVWQPIDNSEITLVNPGPGRQVVKVRAHTLSGVTGRPSILVLDILPPFWARAWFVAGCIVLFIILAVLLVRYFIKRALVRREKKHENELRLLKSEFRSLNALMNPHFIFNTLNSVQGLINTNDKLFASECLRTFADLVRQNMQNVSQDMITLEQELTLVQNYLKLEKLRFKEQLDYEVDIDPDISTDEIMVPPLLVQPLVENAIRHGIMHRQGAGYLKLSVYEKSGNMYIEVTDNGAGISKRTRADAGSAPHALENIRLRIKQLTLMHHMDMDISVTGRTAADGSAEGTTALIRIGC